MRAIIYSRVSTDGQESAGTSLDTQERACLEYAQRGGWLVIDSIRDSASGYSLERPGIERLRTLLNQSAVDVVVVYAVDRLSRNQNQIGVLFDEVSRASARFEFVTEKFEDTAVGRFILAARAFIAEVEREKIAERTTRGKLERARSGRIPQAMGRGTYGYLYNPKTGQREIEPYQAEIVRRIFQRFAETRSFSRVSDELNDDGITALAGGLWYAVTIRRILLNESYTGRLNFRKTRWVATRGKSGKSIRRPVERPADEWIEIPGASPRIIDDGMWERVQSILNNPARVNPHPRKRTYPLVGRIKCGVCGCAMVGHTMKSTQRDIPYYICNHTNRRYVNQRCNARNVRMDRLDAALWSEVRRVLTDPTIVLAELEQRRAEDSDPAEQARIERELQGLREREKRLVRLFTLGEVDEEFIREEGATLRKQRAVLEERLAAIAPMELAKGMNVDMPSLKATCAAIGEWIDKMGEPERQLALEALQITVTATREAATINGVLPNRVANLATEKHASA